jgi:hypothetical protein
MRTEIVIRSETDADAGTIGDVTIAAFSTPPISNHTENSSLPRSAPPKP